MKTLPTLSSSIVLVGALFLASCVAVTKVAYRPDTADAVRTVRVSNEVEMPKKMVFAGFSENMLMGLGAGLGGAVGGALMSAGTTQRKTPDDFRVPDSLANAFAAELRKGGRFQVVTSGPADAELKMEVREYGFLQAGFMRRGVKPYMSVQARLIRRDGKTIWVDGGFIAQNSKETVPQLPEEMKQDPELAVQSLRSAAQVLAAKATASLR